MTPNQLATKLGGTENAEQLGKAFVRPFLRRNFTRDPDQKGTGWQLSDVQIAAVTAAHKAKVDGKSFDFAAWLKARKTKTPKVEA